MQSRKLLIIDDDPAILGIMRHFLSFFGGTVRVAETKKSAIALAEGNEFDLVITDYFLTGTTGLKLLSKLRDKRTGLKAILMSGTFYPSEKEMKSHKLGAFLKKPFDMYELSSALKKTLKT